MSKREAQANYMERNALAFLRAWPDVPEVLRPVYGRFYDAGLIWADPNIEATGEWPSQLRLTEAGEKLKELVDGQSFNFFMDYQLVEIMPSGDLGEVERRLFKNQMIGGTGASPYVQEAKAGVMAAVERLKTALDALANAVNCP